MQAGATGKGLLVWLGLLIFAGAALPAFGQRAKQAYEFSFDQMCQDGREEFVAEQFGQQQRVFCHSDLLGHDLASVPALRAEACFDLCRNHDGCRAFTWNGHAGGTCWLKSAAAEKRQATGHTSAAVQPVKGSQKAFCTGPVPILTLQLPAKPSEQAESMLGQMTVTAGYQHNCYGRSALPHERFYINLRKRGSSSYYTEKSSYALKVFKDERFRSKKTVSFFGLPAHASWVLKGNPYDHIQVKDLLAGELARGSGQWAAGGQLVHLFWQFEGGGSEYGGLFLLLEKIEHSPTRLPSPQGATGDSGGGFMWQYNSCLHASCQGDLIAGLRDIRLEYPEAKKASPAQRAAVKASIEQYWRALREPGAETARLLDFKSFAAYFLHTELSQNVDAYWRSTWFHKKPDALGGQIHAGPIWDLDLAYGQYWDWSKNRVGWMSVGGWRFQDDWRWFTWGHGHGGDINEYAALLSYPPFKEEVRKLWQKLRREAWSDHNLRQQVEAYRAEVLATSFGAHPSGAQHEAFRWPQRYRNAGEMVNGFVRVQTWLVERARWMDAHIDSL